MTATYKSCKKIAQVFDMKHVKSVSATVILIDGRVAGRIVANWSDNPAGSVCTAVVMVWAGPLRDMPVCTGKAGGCGYDKLSAAICLAIRNVLVSIDDYTMPVFDGAGMSSVHAWFKGLGYEMYDVI